MTGLLAGIMTLTPLDRGGFTCEGDGCARQETVGGHPAMRAVQESCGVVTLHSVSWLFVPTGVETGDAQQFEVPDVEAALQAHWNALVDVYDDPSWEIREMPGLNRPGEHVTLGIFGPGAYAQIEYGVFENGAVSVVHTRTPLIDQLPTCHEPEPEPVTEPPVRRIPDSAVWVRQGYERHRALDACHAELEKALGRSPLVWAYTDRRYPRWVDADPGIPLKEEPNYQPEKFVSVELSVSELGVVQGVTPALPHSEARADEAMTAFWACAAPEFEGLVFPADEARTFMLSLKPYSNLGWIQAD
ncbi:MAG: hypothetical protein GY913_32580 [Proteobacteria bacterium]|nr:hypothetical protein [Pseudomonadota bacterium]MCP4921659.1 hypothetical protein [Pseudomonadota bacterium]